MKNHFLFLSLLATFILMLCSCNEFSSPSSSNNSSVFGPNDTYAAIFNTSGDESWNQFFLPKEPPFNGESYTSHFSFNNSSKIVTERLKISRAFINGEEYQYSSESNSFELWENPTVNYDTKPNIFEWTVGEKNYSERIVSPIGIVNLISPIFLETYNKNQSLLIKWTPSGFKDAKIFINLNEHHITQSTSGMNKISNYTKYVDDSKGELIIPAKDLSEFKENQAILSISRGTYKEVTHNKKKYLFIISNSYSININLK